MIHPQLSIIIPTYNEASRIGHSLDMLSVYLRSHGPKSVEVLVIDADSPDGTAKIAASKESLFTNFRVVSCGPRQGKGHNVRVGMLEAKGEYRLFMDADLATPLYYIASVLKLIEEQPPVIIAVRNLSHSHKGIRKIISNWGNRLVQLVLLPGISDTQCGFKAFSADAAEELFRRQTILGWGFDMEILAIAHMLGYSVAQIKVEDWSDQPNGTFEGKVTQAALGTLMELAVIFKRRWTGTYRHKNFAYNPSK